MTLIIAGIQTSTVDEYPDDHAFCLADGMSSDGSPKAVSQQRQKLEKLTPKRKISAGDSGTRGYTNDDALPDILLAQAGAVVTSTQIRSNFGLLLAELYVCWEDDLLVLRHFDNRTEVRKLPKYEDLPPGDLPLLNPEYAAELLRRAIQKTLLEIVRHDEINATNRFNTYYAESFLIARDGARGNVALFRFVPRLAEGNVPVDVSQVAPGQCEVIGSTPEVRTHLASDLNGTAAKKDYLISDLCLVTLLDIAKKGKIKGVGGEISHARCSEIGAIEIRHIDPATWEPRDPKKRDHTFLNRISVALD